MAVILTLFGIIFSLIYYNSKRYLNGSKKRVSNIFKKVYIELIEWHLKTSRNEFSKYAQLFLNDDKLDRLKLSKLIREMKECPKDSEYLSDYLVRLGLYEDLILLSSKGCSVTSRSIMEARNALLALGITKWEKEASKILGKESILSKKADLISLYCTKNKISAYIDGIIISIPPSGSEWRIGDPYEGLESLLESVKPSKIIYWGNCNLQNNIDKIDAKALYTIAFPDSEPSLVSAYFNLMIPSSVENAKAVYDAAIISKTVLENLKIDWNNMPDEVKLAYSLPNTEIKRYESNEVIITDKPRLIKPIWKPYIIKDLPLNGTSWDYAARVSIAVLKNRRGDIAKAAVIKRGNSLDKSLPYLIASNIVKNTNKIKINDQVEPWDLDCINDIENAKLDCTGNSEDCLLVHGLTLWEKELINLGEVIPCKENDENSNGLTINDRINSKIKNLRVDGFIYPNISKLFNISGTDKSKVNVLSYSNEIRDPDKIIEGSIKLINKEGRKLIITPNNALAEIISKSIDSILINSIQDAELWFNSGKIGIISWSLNQAFPEISSVADNIVLLFPERLANNAPYINNLNNMYEYYIGRALELASKYGGNTISRALGLFNNKNYVELVNPKVNANIKEAKIDDKILINEINKIFQKIWRSNLRPYQETGISALLKMIKSENPTAELIILPTGAGKSAIFQISSKVLADSGFGGSAIIVSPLKALIHDQVENAKRKGFNTLYIDSSISQTKRLDIIMLAKSGFLDFLYLTPERFGTDVIDDIFENGFPSIVVLDEAHTLSKWGFSFRPSYLYMATKLQKLRKNGYPPVIALTATAPKDVIDDIIDGLGYNHSNVDIHEISLKTQETISIEYNNKPIVLIAPTIRDELKFDVIPVPESGNERLNLLAENIVSLEKWAKTISYPYLGLIFVPYVESKNMWWFNAEDLSIWLKDKINKEVLFYHGKLSESKRKDVEKKLVEISNKGDGTNLAVVTKAFGMGIDIPNIRFVIHAMPSESIEDFYQESGRAGRDGNEAKIITFYNSSDIMKRKALAQKSIIKPSEALNTYNKIIAYKSFLSDSSGKADLIPIPLKVLNKDEWTAVKYLDILRNSGSLDYILIRGPLKAYEVDRKEIEAVSNICIPMEKGICIAKDGLNRINKEWKPLNLSTSICKRDNKRYEAIISTSKINNDKNCISYSSSSYDDGLISLISLSPGEKRQMKFLDEDMFNEVLRFAKRELQKIEDMQKLIEEATYVRSRNGPSSVDYLIKKRIDEYLTKPIKRIDSKKIPELGTINYCTPLRDCAEKISQTIVKLENNFGEENVTIAVNSIENLKIIEDEYRKITGKTPQFSINAYRKILSNLRKNETEKIMDIGYVVILTKKSSKTEIIEEALKNYKFSVSYFYKF
jgi:ATP-dependent DNA helicase RecQ